MLQPIFPTMFKIGLVLLVSSGYLLSESLGGGWALVVFLLGGGMVLFNLSWKDME